MHCRPISRSKYSFRCSSNMIDVWVLDTEHLVSRRGQIKCRYCLYLCFTYWYNPEIVLANLCNGTILSPTASCRAVRCKLLLSLVFMATPKAALKVDDTIPKCFKNSNIDCCLGMLYCILGKFWSCYWSTHVALPVLLKACLSSLRTFFRGPKSIEFQPKE